MFGELGGIEECSEEAFWALHTILGEHTKEHGMKLLKQEKCLIKKEER